MPRLTRWPGEAHERARCALSIAVNSPTCCDPVRVAVPTLDPAVWYALVALEWLAAAEGRTEGLRAHGLRTEAESRDWPSKLSGGTLIPPSPDGCDVPPPRRIGLEAVEQLEVNCGCRAAPSCGRSWNWSALLARGKLEAIGYSLRGEGSTENPTLGRRPLLAACAS